MKLTSFKLSLKVSVARLFLQVTYTVQVKSVFLASIRPGKRQNSKVHSVEDLFVFLYSLWILHIHRGGEKRLTPTSVDNVSTEILH